MSRSRAALTVSTSPSNDPVLRSHARAKSRAAVAYSANPAVVSKSYRAARRASSPASSTHSTGVEEPTPRGSKPTTS